jgi:4-hydroxybenzoate polyprenyltransferase
VSYEILYDLRDARGDRAAGLRTYPVVHGDRAALRIVDGLLIASLLPLVGGYLAGLVPWRLTIMGAAPLLQLVATKLALRRGGIDSRFCIGLTWLGASLLAIYHFWIVLGLPGA